jgi:hypothetical protein
MSDELNAIPEEYSNIDEIIEEEEFDFEDEEFEVEAPVVDPTQVITLRTSGGETRYIPSDEPLSLAQVKALSGLTFGAVTFYMNAAVIDDATIIPVGSVVTAIGNVKGG